MEWAAVYRPMHGGDEIIGIGRYSSQSSAETLGFAIAAMKGLIFVRAQLV